MSFARVVLHGDEEHRAWLLEAAQAFEQGEPVPPPRGGKLTDEELESRFRQLWVEGGPFYEAARAACDERLKEQKHRIRELESREGGAPSEVEQKGLRLIKSAWEAFCEGQDVDSSELQDWLVKAGVAIEEPYDPARHGPSVLLEQGEPFYVMDAEVRQALSNGTSLSTDTSS